MKPIEDPEFRALLSKFEQGEAIEGSEDWEAALNDLDKEIARMHDNLDAAEEVLEYVVHQIKSPVKPTPDEKPMVGWQCPGCKTGTLSRCLACEEATCGSCLVLHECAVENVHIAGIYLR